MKCRKHISPVSYNFYNGNYAKISKIMSDTNWNSLLNCDINEAYTIFSSVLEIATKELIPLKSNTARTKNIFRDRGALKLRNTKYKAWRKYCRTKREVDFDIFKKCRNKLRRATRDLREQFEINLTNNIKNKPKLEIC